MECEVSNVPPMFTEKSTEAAIAGIWPGYVVLFLTKEYIALEIAGIKLVIDIARLSGFNSAWDAGILE